MGNPSKVIRYRDYRWQGVELKGYKAEAAPFQDVTRQALLGEAPGKVVLGEETHAIARFDCVYVAPGTQHQFRATGREPLGFLCVVDRVRDRPQVVH